MNLKAFLAYFLSILKTNILLVLMALEYLELSGIDILLNINKYKIIYINTTSKYPFNSGNLFLLKINNFLYEA